MPAEGFILKRSNISASTDAIGRVVLRGVKHLSLDRTFDCGQCFRFTVEKNNEDYDEYVSGVAFGKYVAFARKDDTFFVIGSTMDEYKSLWRHFLALDVNYPKLCDSILLENTDRPTVKAAFDRSQGIRILSQDPFEALISFIISQNNNIPRIKGIIERLCKEAGQAFVGFDGNTYYSFPSPEAILKQGLAMLKDIGTGFRAKYIIDACERIVAKRTDFDYIRDCDDVDECVRHLCEIYGVGVKVASCVLLFSFERFDAFPKDVWIKRVCDKYFGEDFDVSLLGDYKGLVQQWLFFYERYLGGVKEA